MGRPQQPELNRSGRTPVDPDHDHTVARSTQPGKQVPRDEGGAAPVPEGNRPGRRDEQAPDQPDRAAFARRLGIVPERYRDPAIQVGRFVARFTTVPFGLARGTIREVQRRLRRETEDAERR